jgi:hypothetical protein
MDTVSEGEEIIFQSQSIRKEKETLASCQDPHAATWVPVGQTGIHSNRDLHKEAVIGFVLRPCCDL